MATINPKLSEQYGIVNYGKIGMEVQRDGKKIAIFTARSTQADNWQDAVTFCQGE